MRTDIATSVLALEEVSAAVEVGEARGVEIGGAAHQLGGDLSKRVDAALRVLARGLGCVLGSVAREGRLPVLGKLAAKCACQSSREKARTEGDAESRQQGRDKRADTWSR